MVYYIQETAFEPNLKNNIKNGHGGKDRQN